MKDISLIKNWHERAKEDFFSRYVFEYLAFEAFLKRYKYTESQIVSKTRNKKERSYIQMIKSDEVYVSIWKRLVVNNSNLHRLVCELVAILKDEPMKTGEWWGCAGFSIKIDDSDKSQRGIINDANDFINIVEFWYQVRNNLFHANKNPDNIRDEKLVLIALKTLEIFVGEVLIPEMESKSFYPAMWEDFEHRFYTGGAEIVMGVNGDGGAANVYELLLLDDSHFPIIICGKNVEKSYIVDKVMSNIINLYGDSGLLREEWERITLRARNKEDRNKLKVYFKDIIPLVKESIGDLGLDK